MPIKSGAPYALCRGPIGPAGASHFTGKSGAYEKSLEVFGKLHMGCAIGKTGPACRRGPAGPLLLYHIEAGLSIGNLHKKKRVFQLSFSMQSGA